MASIGSLGVGSGLDLETLLTKLVSAEGTPRLNILASREASIQADISAFGALKSALDKFRTAVSSLSDADVLQSRTVSTGNSKYFSATASESAVAAEVSVQVLNTARAQKLVTTADFASASDTVGAGTLTISVGGSSFDVTTTAATTLADLKNLINSAAGNTGVNASLIVVARDPQDASAGTVARLVLAAKATGAENTIGVAANDVDGNNTDGAGLSRFYFSAADTLNSQLGQQQAAADARIVVDGFTAFSSSNTFKDVLDGVTITALRDPGDPLAPDVETLTIAQDRSALGGRVNSFVTAYNDLMKSIGQLSSYDAATRKSGPLNGDSTIRGISSRLRAIIGAAGGTGPVDSLASLGITTQRDGTLKLDAARLATAMDDNFEGVGTLFAGTSGIATRLGDALDSVLGSDGLLQARTQGLDRQLSSIGTEREQLNLRLQKLEEQYRARFAALDSLVSQLQNTGTFLSQQLANTSAIITGSRSGGN